MIAAAGGPAPRAKLISQPVVRSSCRIQSSPERSNLVVLEGTLKEMAMRLPIQWMQAPTPHVLFVRTWEGLTVEDIYRGAQFGRRGA